VFVGQKFVSVTVGFCHDRSGPLFPDRCLPGEYSAASDRDSNRQRCASQLTRSVCSACPSTVNNSSSYTFPLFELQQKDKFDVVKTWCSCLRFRFTLFLKFFFVFIDYFKMYPTGVSCFDSPKNFSHTDLIHYQTKQIIIQVEDRRDFFYCK